MDAVEAELEARFAAAVDAMRESEGATVGLRDRIVNVVGEEAAEEQVRQAREAEARKASERPPKAPPARGEGRIFTG